MPEENPGMESLIKKYTDAVSAEMRKCSGRKADGKVITLTVKGEVCVGERDPTAVPRGSIWVAAHVKKKWHILTTPSEIITDVIPTSADKFAADFEKYSKKPGNPMGGVFFILRMVAEERARVRKALLGDDPPMML